MQPNPNHPVSPDRREQILAEMDGIEQRESVKVLYACESGSRAWGFASPDSDYDVRFIYVRRPADYLTIRPVRDVIEQPIDDLLDVSGWDLPKALGLYHKTNPPLFEWLGSPIVYRDACGLATRLRELAPQSYCDRAAGYHYLRMAQKNLRTHLTGDRVKLKKYFYTLRPLLAVRYLEAGLGVVPTEFQKLVDAVLKPESHPNLRAAIDALLVRKQAASESEADAIIPALHAYIESELASLEDIASELPTPRGDIAKLDELFREMLVAAWPEVSL